jgi:hypothetical protein
MIHCIGDSHSSVFSGREEMQPIWPQLSDDALDFFRSYRIGPALAYNLSNKISIINEILFSRVNKNEDMIAFCFGEVDIRAHIKKQSEIQNRSIEDVIKECVDRYWDVIMHYHNLGYKLLVWSPIASWSDYKPYTSGPSFGTSIERNEWTQIFYKYLKSLSIGTGIGILSIFDNMVMDGKTNPDYLDDWDSCHIHLNQKAMPLILEEFKKYKLIK